MATSIPSTLHLRKTNSIFYPHQPLQTSFDQILDYIEVGPKSDLLSKDRSEVEEEDEYRGDSPRDSVLVTDGDSDAGQFHMKSQCLEMRATSKSLNRALRGVRTIICPKEGFLPNVVSLKELKHAVLLSQLSVYEGVIGIQSVMKANAWKLAEEEESKLLASGVPYTIIRAGMLQDTTGGAQVSVSMRVVRGRELLARRTQR